MQPPTATEPAAPARAAADFATLLRAGQAGLQLVPAAEAAEDAPPDDTGRTPMIYEYRVYRCVPGRLPALLKRFENHTTKIWEKHGIRQAGFWTVLIGDGNQDLHYFLAWESLAEREKKWAAFQSDPAWISARAESERDGPIVANVTSTMMVPTSFSSVK
jgi:hypothetical protein